MNILFVLYGDLTSNSANPLALYAREFAAQGHSCTVAIPDNLESIREHANPAFRPVLYSDALNNPDSVFPDGRPADVVHAWTPRENVRRFVTSYMAQRPTPLVVYLEDHEFWISAHAMGLDEVTMLHQTEQSIVARLPGALSHPFRYDRFIGMADVAVVIQEKLNVMVPPWVNCETVMPGVDLDFFSPRAADHVLRRRYGIAENERVIVYPGGVNGFTRPGIETLCRAVGLINRLGYPCKLLRTGPFALDFLDALPQEARDSIVDLGVVPREDLPDLLALADLFVQPGKIDPFEDLRLPGKLPELMAMGRPVVTPNVNIAHLCRDGVNAVLTHTGSAQEMAEKCIALFSDPQQAERMGMAGRQFAEKHFDIKSQAVRMAGAYKIACTNFDASMAAAVWQSPVENDSVDLLLSRKLGLLADSFDSHMPGIAMPGMLRHHAQYIETKNARVNSLESVLSERDAQIANLSQSVVEGCAQIANLSQSVVESNAQIATLELTVSERELQVIDLLHEVNGLRRSASWLITSPLRWFAHQLKRWGNGSRRG